MKLYSGPLSLFTAKVRIALDEKGLVYERVDVSWSLANRYEPHHPEVAALNPKREVPVLIDGETVVYDSTLIFEYLEDRYPEPPLYPREPAARARCRRLEAAADEILFPSVWDLIEESFYPNGSGPDSDRAKSARERVAELCDGLDGELAGCDHLCGRFSVADIGTYIMLNAAGTLGAPPSEDQQNLTAWLARMNGRSAVAKERDAMLAFVQGLFG